MKSSNSNTGATRSWYPFNPSTRVFFRGVGVVYSVGVVLAFLMEGRLSILGCLLAAMFFVWDPELAPKNLRNRIGVLFHWLIGFFFLGLAFISIWLMLAPTATLAKG